MKATVYPGSDGWRWRITGLNNEIVASGEAYVRRRDAESALHQIFNIETLDVNVRGHSMETVEHYTLGGSVMSFDRPEQLELPFEEDPPRVRGDDE